MLVLWRWSFTFVLAVLWSTLLGGLRAGAQTASAPAPVPGSAAVMAPQKAPAAVDPYARESLVIERLYSVYRFAADGTGSHEIRAVTRVQSEAAAQQYSVLRVPFAGASERVEVAWLRVLKADGTVVETPATDAQELPQEVTRQAPLYSDLKELQIPVRSLRVGDRLDYSIRVVRTKAEAPGRVWGQESFVRGVVAPAQAIELHVPAGMYVQVGGTPTTLVKNTSETVYGWTYSQREPTVDANGKARDAEQVDPLGTLPDVAWTSFHSWAEVGAWYRGMEGDRAHADAEVRAKTAELVAGKTTEEEKIEALYAYVATQVRYIGVDLGVGRYQPHAAAEVLRNQYGDCKDKHTLLAAMLDAAGIPADAALIGAGVRMNEEVPSPAAFNHVITAVPMGAETVWLDATAEVAPYRMLLLPVRDKPALRVPDRGEARLARTPGQLPFAAFSSFTVKGSLSTTGMATTHVVYTTRGDDEVLLRMLLRQIAPAQHEQFVQGLSRQLGFSGTVSHAETSRPEATGEPVRMEYDYEREKLGDWDNYRIIAMFPQVYLPGVDEKKPPEYAIPLGAPRVDMARTELTLPAGWGAELPEAVHQETPYLKFDKTYRLSGGALIAERRIEVVKAEIPVAEWPGYKKWMDATLEQGEPFVQLTRTEKKAASEAGPPVDAGGSTESARLVREAVQALQRHDADAGERLLAQAKAANAQQAGLWGAYAYLALERLKMDEAVSDFEKEITLHPDEEAVYLTLAQTQISLGRRTGAHETLRRLLAANPGSVAGAAMLATELEQEGDGKGALAVMRPVFEHLAAEKRTEHLRAFMGSLEMKSGDRAKGLAMVEAVLAESQDDDVLNTAAYSLAEANVDLPKAENASRVGLELLTNESHDWHAGELGPKEMARAALVRASWDTLGWILFREGKLEEAESYAAAAWRNLPQPVVGLHLGRIQEARGEARAAQATYELSRLTEHADATGGGEDAVSMAELKARADVLWQRGLRPAYKDGTAELQRLRTVQLGPAKGMSGVGEYDVLLGSGGQVVEAAEGRETHSHVSGGATMVGGGRTMPGWTPAGSGLLLPRRGALNCHGGMCEFVFYPL